MEGLDGTAGAVKTEHMKGGRSMKKWMAAGIAFLLILTAVGCSWWGSCDLIPMVMVDGVIYMDMGYRGTQTEKPRDTDPRITSNVPGDERPKKDGQSNFGTGYPYRYGEKEGTVELYMDGNWHIFATEEVRAEWHSSPMEN